MNIMITAIGGDIAQSIATIIRERRPDIYLIGADMGCNHAGSLFVDKVIKIPSASSNSYLDSVRNTIHSNEIDIVIPVSEQELSVFGPLIDELGFDRCITAGKALIEIGVDKLKTMTALKSLGIQVPWFVDANIGIPSEYPCIFKSRNGSGSKNIFLVENIEEAKFFANKYSDSIFQENLKPKDAEVTCAVYRRRDGKVFVLQLLRKLTGGLTGWAEVVDDSHIYDMCEKIAKGLFLVGCINVQLIVTDVGPRVFEINPRFSSTVLMRDRIGFTDLIWMLDEIENNKFVFPAIEIGQKIVRVQDARKLPLDE